LQDAYDSQRYPEGVYSTIADKEFQSTLKPLENSELEFDEEPVKINNDGIARAVNGMFRHLSLPSDPRSRKFNGGVENILYGSSLPKIENAEIKGDEQEAQVAMLQSKWYEKETRPGNIYAGLQLKSKRN
jgi:hypothetical protein